VVQVCSLVYIVCVRVCVQRQIPGMSEVCDYVCVFSHTHAHIHTYIHTHAHIHTYTHTHAHTHTHTYTHTHTHTHIYIYIQLVGDSDAGLDKLITALQALTKVFPAAEAKVKQMPYGALDKSDWIYYYYYYYYYDYKSVLILSVLLVLLLLLL